ncbi:HET-domain-containing protein, partial [Glonium stellatum]
MATLIYEKKPLERPRDIRLVTLAPASASSDPICCTLQVVSLDAKSSISSYEALSYCWGSRFRTLPVTCDDETLFVTPNLLEALRRIRKQDEPRTLWVDVLCIDQSDLVELGIQVRQMRDIYAKARRVIVWLG